MAKTHSYTNVLRLILLAYKQQGQQPALKAVSTIYYGMLASGKPVDEATWQLFATIAMLPLKTQKLVGGCTAQGNTCEAQANNGHCRHGLTEVPHVVQLQATDDYLLQLGRQRNGYEQHYWGKQLAAALGGSYTV